MTLLMKVEETVKLMDGLSSQKRSLANALGTIASQGDQEQSENGKKRDGDESLKSIASITESLSILRTAFNNS